MITFDMPVKGINVITKEKITKISDIRRDCSLKHFIRFENLSKANDCDDEQMEIIYRSLIEDKMIKDKLSEDSYKK